MSRAVATAAAATSLSAFAVNASASANANAVAAVAAAGSLRVCFLTDVEGSWSYVRHFARQSSCLLLAREEGGDDEGPSGHSSSIGGDGGEMLQLRDDCVLVFGGDAGDKGDDTLRCYEQLVSLKKRHPERVVLLVGNRDVNKMRLTSELADSELELHAMAREVRDGPLWVPSDKRVTITDFLARQVAADTTTAAAAVTSAEDATSAATDGDRGAALLRAANTKVNRLKWMLEHTMGAQGDFERRRSELAAARSVQRFSPNGGDAATTTTSTSARATTTAHTTAIDTVVDDESVLQSYMESVREGGVVREYLELGSLAFIAHGTLFTHGGIIRGAGGDSECVLGRVPGHPSTIGTLSTSRASSASSTPSTPSAPSSSPPSLPQALDPSSPSSPPSSQPQTSPPPQCRSEVAEWVEELNAWYQQQVQEWIEQPTWNVDRSHRGGNELLKYVLPDHPASVVMGRHLQASGMPAQLPSDAAQALSASGIRRLVVGHTPHGTCPTVIKQKQGGRQTQQQQQQQQSHQQQQSSVLQQTQSSTPLQARTWAASNATTSTPGVGFEEVIMCDTSYSDMAASDNRGVAAVELVVEADGRAHMHGVLPDGRAVAYTSDDPLIGRELQDGTQVKAKLRSGTGGSVESARSNASGGSDTNSDSTSHSDSDEYLVYFVENGFSYTYHYRTRAELGDIGFAD